MAFDKITTAETDGHKISDLPDAPTDSATALKSKFDYLSMDVIIPKFNSLVDDITGSLVNKSDIVNNLTTNDATKPLSAKQGKVLKDEMANYVAKSEVVDNVTSTSTNVPLSAKQGKALNDKFANYVAKSEVVNNLTSTSTNLPLSANMGKTLQTNINTKVNTADIVNNVTSTATNVPLSAAQGKVLNEKFGNYVAKSGDIVNNLESTATNKALSAAQGKVLYDLMTGVTFPIADNLTTDSGTTALSAKQGKYLNEQLANKMENDHIYNALDNASISGYALDSRMGKYLNDKFGGYIPYTALANNVTTTASNYALDARQGKVLNDKFNSYVPQTAIVNNCTTTTGGGVLDARQGKALSDTCSSLSNSLNNKVNLSDLFYSAGEYTLGTSNITGITTTDKKRLAFTVQLPKLLTKVTTATVSSVSGRIRSHSGFVDNASSDQEWNRYGVEPGLLNGTYVTSVSIENGTNSLRFTIKKKGVSDDVAFSNIGSDVPIVFRGQVTFTLS